MRNHIKIKATWVGRGGISHDFKAVLVDDETGREIDLGNITRVSFDADCKAGKPLLVALEFLGAEIDLDVPIEAIEAHFRKPFADAPPIGPDDAHDGRY